MGCRPSRRAVACVRVAGDGPWGIERPSRAFVTGDGEVRLRQHDSTRRSDDPGGRTEVGGGDRRNRYSAPPTDRQFPPHSCTSATYEHGCCGTSRITLRLSKNGSTLEIEKCDFDHNHESCRECCPKRARELSHPADLPQRAQSAPNLSTVPPVDNPSVGRTSPCGLPSLPPRPTHREESDSDTPPPLPPRGIRTTFVQPVMTIGKVYSPPDSLLTATKVDLDIESRPTSAEVQVHSSAEGNRKHFVPPSVLSTADVHSQNVHKCDCLQPRVSNVLARPAVSRKLHAESNFLSSPDLNVQRTNISALTHIPHPTHHFHNRAQTVDLTEFYLSDSHAFHEDVKFASNPSHHASHSKQTGAENATPGETNMYESLNPKLCQGNGPVSSDLNSASHLSLFALDTPGDQLSNGLLACSATDYRIRMLGARDGDSVKSSVGCSHAQIKSSCSIAAGIVMPTRSESQKASTGSSGDANSPVIITPSSTSSIGSQVLCNTSSGNSLVRVRIRDNQGKLMLGSRVRTGDDSQAMMTCAGMLGVVAKWDRFSDESTDTGCESDEESEKSQLLARLEMAPAYVHGDFKNDFEDLFDDSSPGFDTC